MRPHPGHLEELQTKITYRPLSSRLQEAWIELDGVDQLVRVRNSANGGRDILNLNGQVEVAKVSEDDLLAYVIERRRTAEENRLAAIEETKAMCGYVQPPADLLPEKCPTLDPKDWDRLHDCFAERTKYPNDAVLVALADKRRCSILVAYIISDGWAKRRSPAHFRGGYN